MKRLAIASVTLFTILFSGCGGSNSGLPHNDNTNRQSDVQITKVNHAPVATLSTLNIARNVSYDGQLTAKDADGDMLKYVIVDKPKHGTVVLHDDGCFTYTPNRGYQGVDTFSYKASDDVSSCKVKKVTVHVKEPTIQIPKAPTNLTIKALSTTKLELHWEDNADNEKGYVIYKDAKPVCTAKANVTSAIISCGLKAGTTYTFEVRAQNEAGRSTPATATGTTKDVTTPPKAPTNLKAKAVGKRSLRLTWEDNADNESGYEIYQDGKLIKTISPNCHCTVIKDLKEATTYEFVVKAVNKLGSASSNRLTVTTLSSKPVVDAGADKTITEGESVTLTVTVSDPNGTIQSYVWKEGNVVKGNSATLTLNNLSEGVHIFTVTVTNDKGAETTDTVRIEVKKKKIQTVSSTKTYTYDSAGRVIREDFNDGRYIEYTYDDNGNLINQNVVGGK